VPFKTFADAENAINKDKNNKPTEEAPISDSEDMLIGPKVDKPSTEASATKP
jgi:hypothetical protein